MNGDSPHDRNTSYDLANRAGMAPAGQNDSDLDPDLFGPWQGLFEGEAPEADQGADAPDE